MVVAAAAYRQDLAELADAIPESAPAEAAIEFSEDDIDGELEREPVERRAAPRTSPPPSIEPTIRRVHDESMEALGY